MFLSGFHDVAPMMRHLSCSHDEASVVHGSNWPCVCAPGTLMTSSKPSLWQSLSRSATSRYEDSAWCMRWCGQGCFTGSSSGVGLVFVPETSPSVRVCCQDNLTSNIAMSTDHSDTSKMEMEAAMLETAAVLRGTQKRPVLSTWCNIRLICYVAHLHMSSHSLPTR